MARTPPLGPPPLLGVKPGRSFVWGYCGQRHIDRFWKDVFGDLGAVKEEAVRVVTPITDRVIMVPHVNAFHCLVEILLRCAAAVNLA